MTREELISMHIATGKPVEIYVKEAVIFPHGEWITIDPARLRRGFDYQIEEADCLILIQTIRKEFPAANPHGDDDFALPEHLKTSNL